MEKEFQDFDSRNAWGTIYQEIRNASNNFNYTFKDARRSENKSLNRYRDVNPFDHSRVRLQRGDKDYINASLVKVPSANRSYILTQGPLPATIGHFWLMVWEQKSKAILMLNKVIEKNAVKCHQYWPLGRKCGGEDELLITDVSLKVTYISEKEAPNYTTRELLLTDLESGQSRTVLQFHYNTWPDFGVPESPAAFLNFLQAVRDSGALNANVGPAVVHCSAGIGRSGTFCLVDSCLVLIERNCDLNSVNIRELLLEMRHHRMGLIQTPDQLRFSYMAIIEGAKKILQNKSTDNTVPLETNEGVKLMNNINNSEKSESYEESDGEHSEEITKSESSDEVIKYSHDEKPPPLPPRSARHSEDLSPSTLKNISESCEVISAEEVNEKLDSKKDNANTNQISDSSENARDPSADTGFSDQAREIDSLHSTVSEVVSPESASDIRKRRRKERSEKTAELVQQIKKKQKESETRQKRRLIIKRTFLGLAILFGTGFLVYRFYPKG